MFLDIVVPLLAAIAQGLTGFVGWRVTVDGVRKEKQVLYECVFAISTVIGIVCVGVTAYRASVSSRELTPHARLRLVPKENNLALPEPLSETRPLRVNFETMNMGTQDASNASGCARVALDYGDPEFLSIENRVWRGFVDWCKQNKNLAKVGPMLKGDIPFGIPYWSTNEPPYLYLSTQQIDDIRQAKAHIFTNVAILFDDNFGSHVQEGCWWIQAPADPQSPWHECSVHHTQVDNQDEFLRQQ